MVTRGRPGGWSGMGTRVAAAIGLGTSVESTVAGAFRPMRTATLAEAVRLAASVTVSFWLPTVGKVAEKVCAPRSPAVNVYAAGRVARLSLQTNCTVPR